MKKQFLLVIATLIMGGVSAQNDMYVEMKMTSTQGANGSFKIYHSTTGSRTEVDMQIPKMPGAGMKNVYLHKNDQPNLSYIINDKDKTYTEIKINENDTKDAEDKNEYTVKKLGTETVNGYKCTHALITSGKESYEVWNTKDIADYNKISSLYNNDPNIGSYKREKALKDAGCDGFPVKMVHKGGDEREGTITIEMVKMEKKALSNSLFQIPAGYTKTESMMPGSPFNPADLQKMTPEQRQKYIEDMKKKYGGGE